MQESLICTHIQDLVFAAGKNSNDERSYNKSSFLGHDEEFQLIAFTCLDSLIAFHKILSIFLQLILQKYRMHTQMHGLTRSLDELDDSITDIADNNVMQLSFSTMVDRSGAAAHAYIECFGLWCQGHYSP